MLLAGDIGGTKTDLAVFSAESGPAVPLANRQYRSGDYPSLEAIVHEFLDSVQLPVDYACFDVAGPVIDGRAKITNLPWFVDEDLLCPEFNFKEVWLLNDLEAIARAVPILKPEDLVTLNARTPLPGGAIAVIAPGTGLGEGFLTWTGTEYQAHPSEGGHADFAPNDDAEAGLLKFQLRFLSHVSVERVASGSGLPHIYDYLCEVGYAEEEPEIAAEMAAAKDRTPIIVREGVDPMGTCKLCRETIHMFVSILASESGNMALKVLSTGGVYLGGGIPPRVLRVLQEDDRFMKAFLRKGRFNDILREMPVHVIMTKAALLGTAYYGLKMAANSSKM